MPNIPQIFISALCDALHLNFLRISPIPASLKNIQNLFLNIYYLQTNL